jgi:succinoglycan biosynthesis transport protein ExoP
MTEKLKDIHDYVDFIKRRKFYIIIPFLCIFVLVGLITILLPSIYRSNTTILIEAQQIPVDLVRSTVTGYVEERIQTITQQIMSRSRLLEIINRFNLYQNLRDRFTTDEIVEEMRGDIKFETISAEVISEKTGRPSTATIAFNVSYEGKDPSKVQNVANVLASLYLEENLRTREQRAKTTTAFLEKELSSLNKTIADLEKRIAAFKSSHIGELPELMQLNLQTEQQIRREMEEVDRQIRTLEDRKVYLEGQLATVKPDTPLVDETGRRVLDAKERLRLLRMDYISLSARVSEKHPDIANLKKEISDLEKTIGDEGSFKEKQKELEYKKAELKNLQSKYSEKHPDVIKLKKEINLLEKEVEALSKNAGLPKDISENPENPAYINLSTQIRATEIEIASLKDKRPDLNKKWHEYLRKIENTPRVEKDYVYLLRDYDTAKIKYRETTDKLMEAKRAEELEEAQSSEKFTIIDPAQFPEKPYKPKRLAIILIGFILATGSGVGFGSVTEYLDHSVRTADDLAKITGVPVLSTIPIIVTDRGRLRERRIRRRIAVISAISLVVIIVVFHFFVMNLDLLWVEILRSLNI